MQDNLQLVGQVAAVAGGGREIGRAIAATLSAAGATTAVLRSGPLRKSKKLHA